MTRYVPSGASPTSRIRTTCRDSILRARRASRRKRERATASAARSGRSSFSATIVSFSSAASKTSPVAPSPSSRRRRYAPTLSTGGLSPRDDGLSPARAARGTRRRPAARPSTGQAPRAPRTHAPRRRPRRRGRDARREHLGATAAERAQGPPGLRLAAAEGARRGPHRDAAAGLPPPRLARG